MTRIFSGEPKTQFTGALSVEARQRMLRLRGEPFFFSGWKRVAFIHFEVDPKILQREVPFELDLHNGKAYVSLVAFHLENMRPRLGGKLAAFLMKPVATHKFLNIRAYVRHGNETGIYFLAEYLPNKLSLHLGPLLYGLPYRLGKLDYHHQHETREIFGRVSDGKLSLNYRIDLHADGEFQPCEAGTLDEFLLERYTAFTFRNGICRHFCIWHPPWPQMRVEGEVSRADLLLATGDWFQQSQLIGAHYSPGIKNVWMGRPRCFRRVREMPTTRTLSLDNFPWAAHLARVALAPERNKPGSAP
ncbi:MAG: DUF2071 domain-containing protein [Verrucomicrobiota bacterium]